MLGNGKSWMMKIRRYEKAFVDRDFKCIISDHFTFRVQISETSKKSLASENESFSFSWEFSLN